MISNGRFLPKLACLECQACYHISFYTDDKHVTPFRIQKQTADQLYLGRPHGHVGVYGVQVWGDVVITGAADASLVLLSNMQGTWTVTQKVTTGTSYITHLDSDGDMLAVGTHTGVQLWKVENRMNTEGDVDTRLSHTGGLLEERGAKLVVWMLVVSGPYVVVVGGEEWGGVQVESHIVNSIATCLLAIRCGALKQGSWCGILTRTFTITTCSSTGGQNF